MDCVPNASYEQKQADFERKKAEAIETLNAYPPKDTFRKQDHFDDTIESKEEPEKERFLRLCEKVKRPGMDRLIAFLQSDKSDFFTAPASSNNHSAFEGGLLHHSLSVYDELERLANCAYTDLSIPEESIILSALFHDLCKVNCYEVDFRNKKNPDNTWSQVPFYRKKEKFAYGGHGSKSVFMLSNFIKLTPAEAVAINCHMGSWNISPSEATGLSQAYSQCPLAFLLHVADESSTFLKETDRI